MRVLFVHGAFVRDGSWWWARVADALAGSDFASEAVKLPSCGEGSAPPTAEGPGLLEDATELGRMIDAGGDTIIAASSYGGTVVAEAAARPNVHHLLYISSFLPTVGATHAGVVASPADPVPVRANPDGSVSVVDDESPAFDDRFLHDVSASALIRGAHERLTAQSPAAFTTPTTAAAWQRIPSTYLVCTADRNTDVSLQREHAARATHVVELPTGHHPFLSRPDLVADELRTIASS